MANPDASFGLIPLQNYSNAEYSGKLRKVAALASYGTGLFIGDPVLLTGDSVADAEGQIVPIVQRAAASGYISGVVVGVIPDTAESLVYRAASTLRYLLIDEDPYSLFEIQADGSMATTDVGNTADLIFTNAGSTVTGQAGAELDTADIGTGTQLVIEGFRQQGRNDLTSANPVALVRINLHSKRNTTGV